MSVYIFALGIKSANGLVKSTINTANALSDRGIDVTIINVIGKNGGFEFLDPSFPLNSQVNRFSLDAMSLEYESPNLNKEILHIESQEYLKATYTGAHKKVLQKLNEKLTCNDLIIFSHPLAMVVFSKANPQTSAKTIIQVHGNYSEEVDNLNLLKGYLDYVDYIQTVSKYMRDDLIKILNLNPESVICIYNITRPIKNLIRKKDKLKRISIIGSIQDRKNQLDAIRMLSTIEDRNIVLQIYGNTLRKEYRALLDFHIKNYGLTDRVLFKGIASERDIYENTDIAIMPSKHEGFGYIFLECALYGIPVVAYDFKYGAKEFSQNNKNGCLVDMGDYKTLAKNVQLFLNDINKYEEVVSINREFFINEYNENSIIELYLSLFENKNNELNWSNNHDRNAVKISNLKLKDVSEKVFEPWNNNLNEMDFYQISFEVTGDIKNAEFYYVYKKSKFPIQKIAAQPRKYGFIKKLANINNNKEEVVKLNIPKVNRISMGKLLNNFDVILKKDSYEESIASIRDSSLKSSNIKDNMVESYLGSFSIKDIPHILKPNGLYIRYPSLDAICLIENERGEPLEFVTQVMKYYGKEYVFFKLKTGLYENIKVLMNSGDTLEIKFSNYSYGDVFNKIIELENTYNLFDLKINDIHIWELIRVSIFENILEAVGVLDKHFSKPSVINNEYFGNKSLGSLEDTNEKKLIFEFPRKGIIDYKTVSIKKMFKKNSVVFEYPQRVGYSDDVYNAESSTYPLKEFLDFSKSFDSNIQFSREENSNIKWLKEIFIRNIGIEIEFSLYIKSRILKYLKEFTYFNEHFKLHKYDEVLIPSAYWSAGIISAAKANGITTSDIQYAVISKYHPSFSFSQPARAYGPDRIYLWSKYWNIGELTYNKSFIMDGNYFSEKIQSMDIDKSKPYEYDVAFVSQSRIGRRVFDFALNFAIKYPNKNIVFCPHPDEDYTLYPKYYESISIKNLVTNIQYETLEKIYCSENVVGVYSTSLIEALALEKKVFVLKLSGYELYEKEINKGFMDIIENPEELYRSINKEEKLSENKNLSKLFFNHTRVC